MNDEQIKEVIFKVLGQIAPEADLESLTPDENIQRKFDIDSFDALTFFININEELGVEVSESDYGKLTTLTEIIAYISKRLN